MIFCMPLTPKNCQKRTRISKHKTFYSQEVANPKQYKFNQICASVCCSIYIQLSINQTLLLMASKSCRRKSLVESTIKSLCSLNSLISQFNFTNSKKKCPLSYNPTPSVTNNLLLFGYRAKNRIVLVQHFSYNGHLIVKNPPVKQKKLTILMSAYPRSLSSIVWIATNFKFSMSELIQCKRLYQEIQCQEGVSDWRTIFTPHGIGNEKSIMSN